MSDFAAGVAVGERIGKLERRLDGIVPSIRRWVMAKFDEVQAKIDERDQAQARVNAALAAEVVEINDKLKALQDLVDQSVAEAGTPAQRQAAVDQLTAGIADLETTAQKISDIIQTPPPPTT